MGQKWVKNWVKFGSKSGSRGLVWAIKIPKLLKLRDLRLMRLRRERFVNQTLLTRCN